MWQIFRKRYSDVWMVWIINKFTNTKKSIHFYISAHKMGTYTYPYLFHTQKSDRNFYKYKFPIYSKYFSILVTLLSISVIAAWLWNKIGEDISILLSTLLSILSTLEAIYPCDAKITRVTRPCQMSPPTSTATYTDW